MQTSGFSGHQVLLCLVHNHVPDFFAQTYSQVSARYSDDADLPAVDLHGFGAVLVNEMCKRTIVIPHQLRFRNIQIERLLISTCGIFEVHMKGLIYEMSNRRDANMRLDAANSSYRAGLSFGGLNRLGSHSITPFRFQYAPPA